MKNRILSAVLSLALCLGLAVPAWAAGPAFTDVPADHWAYGYVEDVAQKGWMTGYGGGRFGPDDKVSYAQFYTMVVRAFFPDELAAYSGSSTPWERPYMVTALDQLRLYTPYLVGGTGVGYNDSASSFYGGPLNRSEMAIIISRAIKAKGITVDYDRDAVIASIADYNAISEEAQAHVLTCVAAGIISGVDSKGTFSGKTSMTRAQAAVVLTRMGEVIEKGGVTTNPTNPTEPTNPTDPTKPTTPSTGDSWTLKNGKPVTEENVLEMLAEIREQYPTGTRWAEPDVYPDTLYNPNPATGNATMGFGTSSGKYGCGGFAAMVSDLIFPAEAKAREVTDFSQVRPGDIIVRVNSKTGATHHIMVAVGNSYYRDGSNFTTGVGRWEVAIADGNHNDMVIWSEDSNNRSSLCPPDAPGGDGSIHYVYTRYPN